MKKITIFLFLFVSVFTNAQQVTVSGKIVDKNQEVLTGATVLIKETNQGISTDLDGNFTLKLNKGTFTIQVSYIGFKTIEKNVYLDDCIKLRYWDEEAKDPSKSHPQFSYFRPLVESLVQY